MFPRGFPQDSVVKNLPADAGDSGSIPGSRRSPGGGNGNPLQYSCLGNPMDREAWRATVHGATKSQTQLSDWTITIHFPTVHLPCDTQKSKSPSVLFCWLVGWFLTIFTWMATSEDKTTHWISSASCLSYFCPFHQRALLQQPGRMVCKHTDPWLPQSHSGLWQLLDLPKHPGINILFYLSGIHHHKKPWSWEHSHTSQLSQRLQTGTHQHVLTRLAESHSTHCHHSCHWRSASETTTRSLNSSFQLQKCSWKSPSPETLARNSSSPGAQQGL